MAIVLMGCEAREVPIKPKEIAFDKEGKSTAYVDSKGNKVKKIQLQGSEYKWVYDNGSECSSKTFKSIKGKPVKPFSKTTVINKYDTIDIKDMGQMVNNELTYMLVSSQLKDKLKELAGQGLSFKFVNRGFKVYRAVAYYDTALDRSLMRCFRGDLRQVDLTEGEEISEIETSDVESLDLDSLEV
jgi:hypothetical protein